MKKHLLKPGLEVVFSLSVLTLLCLPPLVMAQSQKDFEIKIINGDTTINGKDIKKLSKQERADAMQEMGRMGNITNFRHMGKDGQADIIVRRRKDMRGDNLIVEEDRRLNQAPHMNGNDDNASSPYKTDFYNNNDALEPPLAQPRMRLRRLPQMRKDSIITFRLDGPPQPDLNGRRPPRVRGNYRPAGPRERERFMTYKDENTQTFNFSNTDADGIRTNISFNVSDDRNGHSENDKNYLNLTDLSLSPEFSTGKTALSFNLPAKTAATLKLTDSQGRALFGSKVIGGSFDKKINLPLNGIYLLTVKQGAHTVTKRIVKEN